MDIKEEITRAFAADEIKQEIARLKAPPKTTVAKISDFFESKFGGWFMGTVLLGALTFGWGFYQEKCGDIYLQKKEARDKERLQKEESEKQSELAKSREDAAFLGQMFIEASKDENEKKCRIAQLMQLRNADCDDESKSAPCQWLMQFKREIKAEDRLIESCESVIVNVVKQEEREAIKKSENSSEIGVDIKAAATRGFIAENPNAAQIIKQLPPRAYIQIFSETDREKSRELTGKLKANGFIVPGVENVGDERGNKAKPMSKNIIRCYNGKDCEKIGKVKEAVAPDFEIQPIAGNTNNGSIEFWFKAP